MAKKPGQSPQAIRDRAAKTAAVMATPSAVAAQAPKKKTSIAQFFREVRAEARKITWTSRKETWITSVMVAIMVVMAALFFWLVNSVLNFAITWLLRVATGG
ncbi:MAG: preprotein translocase subunit SecE [Phenylobacterium sp.]|jgi:preprotein translocase subunit SecE|uniref:preprotein translocase subunit SecE n=1 Tax=unclassified Phenylobacterium TaxID=2640670 RepID=UPI0008C060F0|nr:MULTISPECIES: preprotein translocase subunit SecE [unclassified Phenylobacterium]MBJ7413141.1 preprotein translocase subunit SecE [Phenylobacterium sp.]OHB28316.1 MAG: preprotein translocase subunit SecE [Phenylobacterium sp. RIFCSPHIGHO2_01_FULL_69_31]